MSQPDPQPRIEPETQVNPRTCPECKAEVPVRLGAVETTFCPACGQRLIVPKLKFTEIVGEVVGTLFSLELPILRTLRNLCLNPGAVADAWIAGRRRSYINPLKLMVIAGLATALVADPIQELQHSMQPDGVASYDTKLSQHGSQNLALFCMLLLIPIAGTLRAFDPLIKARRSLVEWYILGLYTYGLGVILQLTTSLFGIAFPRAVNSITARLLIGTAPALLFAWGAYGFVPRSRRWVALLSSILGQAMALAMIAIYRQWIATR